MANLRHFIYDGHLDLAMNAMEWNRDLRKPLHELRKLEEGMHDKPDRGNGTVAFPEMRKGRIGLCTATLIARYVKSGNPIPGWNSPEQAWAQTQGQMAWYKAMEEAGEMVMIRDKTSLIKHIDLWAGADEKGKLPVGYVLSLEGADSMIDLSYVEKSFEAGLRAIGPAHYGPGTYAFGTDSSGGLSRKGKELLMEMGRLGMILDVTHLCDESFWEAIELFRGPVWASHNNSRVLVPHNRQFSDDQIKILIRRKSVIGVALDAWMLAPGWEREKDTPASRNVTLFSVADHIDHFCQLAGNSEHVAIGSDLDGAFGKEQCPLDLETIEDLNRFPSILRQRGYSESDLANILCGNWIRFLENNWK